MTSKSNHHDVVDERDLRTMLREVNRKDGVRRLLRWLASRLDGSVVLLTRTGETVGEVTELSARLLEEAGDVINSVVEERRQSASTDLGGYAVRAIAIGGGATLVVAKQGELPVEAGPAITDAANLVRLQWRADQAQHQVREARRAESFIREAVLHLIMVGHIDGARRSAGALHHALPDLLRVYLIESEIGDREQPARLCDEASGGSAWMIPCPVYSQHLIVLARAESEERRLAMDEALRRLAVTRTDLRVGVGQTVALRQTAVGYEQAFHALAVARTIPASFAEFSAQTELLTLLGSEGRGWASHLLSPLLEFVPERSQDPDADELISTLRTWLSFHSRAASQLKIHRNTLAARLQRIERTLACDIGDVATQAKLHLALRLMDSMGRTYTREPESLETLLSSPPVRHWARTLLGPLLDNDALLTTLRVWLDNDTRVESTAADLGVSVPGTRKRLVRIEQVLGRSLLNGPSARYDLLIALRLHDDAAF